MSTILCGIRIAAVQAACLAAVVFQACVLAEEPQDRRGGLEAVLNLLGKAIARFDADKDGNLSAQERDTLVESLRDAMGEKAGARVADLLKKADADSDGTLTAAEWKAFEAAAAQKAGKTAAAKTTCMVPMSDGAKLATDVYLPEGEGPFPVLLARTPYGKGQGAAGAAPLLAAGIAGVVQDMRGRFDSEGENVPFIGCGWGKYKDGAETVAWIRKQPWCNGKVATWGTSAGGITQNLMAGAAPEGLVAQYIQVAAASMYHHASYVGGAFRKCQVEGWTKANEFGSSIMSTGSVRPYYDDAWRQMDSTTKFSVMNVPAVHLGGWFDTFSQGTIDAFVGRQHFGAEGSKGMQKLVMGPWDHGGWRNRTVGDLRFPGNGIPKAYSLERWIEHHLKGVDNGIMKEPAVTYYVMGDSSDSTAPGNQWRFADDWPVPSTPTEYFFAAGGGLSKDKPIDESIREYTFDPADPCPTIGGCNLTIPRGPRNQNPVESRKDVLVFTTPVLDEPVEVTGRVWAKIRIGSTAVDTDLSVRLCDVYPDGKSYLMAEGMLRLRCRESFEKPVLLTPGAFVDASVDCWSTSIVFNRGHRIRVTVASGNFPRFDVNPGTGKPWESGGEAVKQTNRIVCGGGGASRVVLPVVAQGGRK